ncbi:hypothetical protein DCCM_4001 [Desulfocucumis palustris]|uniref:Uncharacterized protein n=1 Tax=Desulfocucumis palustris TaxID=1898651 RepID=A0A2L2XLP8_9FIRM|nr:hypothetical protein DCCM_4001 [Desulfocucumis palustris]
MKRNIKGSRFQAASAAFYILRRYDLKDITPGLLEIKVFQPLL